MANEITGTTITHIINSEAIEPAFQDYVHDWIVALKFYKAFLLAGKSTATVAVPSLTSQMGTVSDGGGSVDTEFDATDGTDLENTALALSQQTIATSEMGIMREITDTALADVVMGFDLISVIVNDNARILATALEDDAVALFGSLANAVGTDGNDLTLANLDSAIVGIAKGGVRAPDGLVGVLDDEQEENFTAAIRTTGSTNVVYDATADRFMAIERDLNNGLTDGRFAVYKNVNLYRSGLTDTNSSGASVMGAVFVPDTPANTRMACFGVAWSHMPRFALERNESKRSTEIITTQRAGVGELLDAAGRLVQTDAP
jgi:hypothetical protein